MRDLHQVIREDWDRVTSDVLFMAFGIWALIDHPTSQSSTTPYIFTLIFNVEFIILGFILLIGTLTGNYKLKLLGFIIYIIALVTMAGLIAFVSKAATSLLVLALALRGITSIKELRARKQFLADLNKVLKGPPPGDKDDRN